MNKGFVVAVCAMICAVIGVALAEGITTNYALRLVIVGLGGAIGGAVGSLLAGRRSESRNVSN